MRFKDWTTDERVRAAIHTAEKLIFPGSIMVNEIENKNDWRYGVNLSGSNVAYVLYNCSSLIDVKLYKSKNPWTRAIGYYDGKSIYINARKLPELKHSDLVGLLIHEYAHECGFSHGSNFKTKEKCLHSVPYYLSENVSKWL